MTEKGDVRKTYLLRVASYILGLNITEEKLKNTQPLDSFCDTNVNILVISRTDQKIELHNKMRHDGSNTIRVVFYKTSTTSLNNENYKNITNVITVNGNLNKAFLKSVQHVFGKELTEQAEPNKQLIAAVNELEESLIASVDNNHNNEFGTGSIQDEINFWKGKSSSEAKEYSEAFSHLAPLVDAIQSKRSDDFSGLVESFEETVDELWNATHHYPQAKMKLLLDSMASFLSEQIASRIDESTIWRGDNWMEVIRTGIESCEQWELSIQLLTTQTWPRNVENQWNGDPPSMKLLHGFKERLEEIISLKQLGSQMEVLLNEKGVAEQVTKTIELSMKGMNPLAYNPFTEPNWKARLHTAEKSLEAFVDRAIPILKQQLVPSGNVDQNISSDLEKFKSFLSRSNIKEKLRGERETLLSRLRSMVDAKNRSLEEKLNMVDVKNYHFLTEVAAKIVWVRQQIAQMNELKALSSSLLSDLEGYQLFLQLVDQYSEKLKYAERENFDDWSRQTTQLIEDQSDSIALETTGRIMVLEKNSGNLSVNYSDRLLRLLKEVRQLSSLGISVPSKIAKCASNAEKYYKYGVTLKQIAHFYNTIDQQMLPCQQALMLEEALAFEKLILPKKDGDNAISKVTWNDPKQLEEFIRQLQTVENKLSEHNRRLRNVHEELTEWTSKLMDLNLVKQNAEWREIIGKIRSKIKEEEVVHGASKSNIRPWKNHWDRQLYKALKVQYEWGIESIHTQLSTINVQLVFVDQKVQLRPPLEEIRSKYYKELTKFLRIPDKFRGVNEDGADSKFFGAMIDRSISLLPAIYHKAETLMEQVAKADAVFVDWLVVSQIDLEELIEEKLASANDWEAQFKILKAKSRETEKLPSEIKIECIVVNTSGVRKAIEDGVQRVFDSLTWTLRHSINTTSQGVQAFLTKAVETLSNPPASMEEIAEANQKRKQFAETNKTLKEEWKIMQEKHTLLRSVAGSSLENVSSLEQLWQKFELMLDSYAELIKDQVDSLKTKVDTETKRLSDDAEKLKAKWEQLKPRSEALQGNREEMLKAINFIKEKREEWAKLAETREKIEKERDQFNMPAMNLNIVDDIDRDLKEFEDNWLIFQLFNDELDEIGQEEWIVFRSKMYLFDELLQKWTDKLKTGTQTHMSVRLTKDVEQWKEISGLLKFCRGEVLSADNWSEMFRMLGLPRTMTIEKLKLSDLLGVSSAIVANVDQLKQLNTRAQGELAFRQAIQELTFWAAQAEFTLADYKHANGNTIKVIKDWKDAINSVKDSQALLQSLKASPLYASFSDKTGIWETRLADLDVFLSQMNEIQRKWIYLEPIFGRGALPSEASRFGRVDSEYRAILNDVSKDPRLVSLCNRQSLKRSLEQVIDQLNRCQKALNQFLEQKRNTFPRFYFIGDDDLLEILGQSTNPTVIQSHMKKLFQGINQVFFSGDTITAMISAEGETVPFKRPVRVVPQVETWLQQISDEMRQTLMELTAECVRESTLAVQKYPSQVLCLAEEIKFCSAIEESLNASRPLASFKTTLQEKLKLLTNTQPPDEVTELKLKSLILDLIHHIDVVDQLMKRNSSSIKCWTWQRQLRFYMVQDKVVLRQVYSEFNYTYEYQGNYAKLVHTPLTDKCYLTLTQAMYMGLGGNPYGPAGTGKTETVKALAAQMGRQVLVFNCDEGIDVKSMGRIFAGIVECGAWGCFDEFNRLDSTVLSAVSMQIQTIQDAIKSGQSSCTISNKTVQVNPNSAIFITLNPAGKGYGGRQKLPDNLKQLFRAVAMSVPDNQLISQTILYSEGFVEASSLAKKIITIFKLSKEMLSRQQHYDWGLRALKTVLRGCGNLRRMNPEKKETTIVVQALLLNTLSKLTFSDARRFDTLVDDIFSKPEKIMTKFDDLTEPLKKASEQMGIELSEKQLEKVFQLYEQLRQRMGVVIVGSPGSGKSTIWKVLHKALLIAKTSLRTTTFNPKAVNRSKLLGNMDMDTREWSDGIITMAARDVIKDKSLHQWIICDGDIDPEWIEALNSVLDDNRLLTMPSGERIQFGTNVNFLFETHSLIHASPATVSRMGMIFISEEDVTPHQIVKGWLKENSEDVHNDLGAWMEESFYKVITWAKDHRHHGLSLFSFIRNALAHLKLATSKKHYNVLLLNGVSPLIIEEKRAELAKSIIFYGESLPMPSNPENVYYDARLDTLMAYTEDSAVDVTREELLTSLPFVLTTDASRCSDIVSNFLDTSNRQSFILNGPDGSGKQHLLNHCFYNDESSQVATFYCSAQSNSSHLLNLLQQNTIQTSGTTGRVLKPKEKENLIVFLKGINLPSPDKYGTNEMLALLHQLLTYQGFYDANLEWISIENIQFVGSMSTLVDGSQIPQRLLSLMRCAFFDIHDDRQLTSIYSTFLGPILEVIGDASRAEILSSQMVQVYTKTKATFKSTENAIFNFTTRDVTKWVLSLLRYDLNGKLPEIVAYEANRIFKDRLATDEDKEKFENILNTVMSVRESNSLFVSTSKILTVQGSVLEEVKMEQYQLILMKSINRFEFEVANFDSPLTSQFTEFIAFTDRVMTSPGGNLLLAGRPGIGRRDGVRLLGHYHNMKIFSPPYTPNYGRKIFDGELKNAITTVINDNEHVILLLEDHQLPGSVFLQSINSLLSSGSVPGLFTQQELDGLAATLSDAASQASFTGHLHQFLAHRVKDLLHVVVILDVDSDDFNINLTNNPALLKNCDVIYSDRLSQKSMLEIPQLMLAKQKIEYNEALAKGFDDLITSIPQTLSIIPIKYRNLVTNYAKILRDKVQTVETKLNRLESGVSKLNEAREEVAKLQKKAAKKSKLLAEKQFEADEALKAITSSMTGAEDQKTSMEQLKADREKENIKIEEQRKVIDEQLKEVEPMIRAAREAVGSIKSESLSEIRSLRAPPEAIRDILQAVLLFMGILDTSWEAMRKFLSKSGVKQEIIEFDAHRITADVHKKVTALVKAKSASFEEKNAKRASVAAAPLAAWVMANLQYSQILDKISPLENEKNKLMKNLARAEKQMEKLSAGLASVDETVADLKNKFEVLMKEATQIKIDVDKEQEIIRVAGTLVESLSGEFTRWKGQTDVLREKMKSMMQSSLITAAFVTYLGECSEKDRQSTLKSILQNMNLKKFKAIDFAATDGEKLNWKNKGLPSDNLSLENGIIMFNSDQIPVIIDPSGQISTFLQNFLEKSEILKAAQSDILTQVELAIRFGKTIIIDDVTTFDATFLPILRRDCASQGPRQVINLGGKQIDYNPEFRMFLCSKSDVKCRPNERSRICLVNFTTTFTALSEQLLGLAMKLEKPEMEQKSSELMREADEKRVELERLEELLLQQLASSQGNLIENTVLVESLNKSKESAETIGRSIAENEKLHAELSQQREAYVPLSVFASSLFFSFSNLHAHNQMYNYNVNTILGLFRNVIISCSDKSSTRTDTLARQLLLEVYYHVSRGMFKNDRLMFSLNFIHATMPKMFQQKEWEILTKAIVTENNYENRISWLPDEMASAVGKLQLHLPTLYNNLQLHDQATWATFAKGIEAEKDFPRGIEEKLSSVQKLIVIQAIRPDRLYNALVSFVLSTLNITSINPPNFGLKDVYTESTPSQPILLILADGADPTQELVDLANGENRTLVQISMGQGQEEKALSALKEASDNGSWLCLSNLHLMLQAVPILNKELSLLNHHKDFRLWLTTEPDERFPSNVLQQCFKVTFEAPPGMKNNLLRTYGQIEEKTRSVVTSQSIFVASWLHALLQERRTFIPQSWTKFYEFGSADIRVARAFIEQIVEKNPDWEFVRGILQLVIYGGRLESVYDSKVLEAYILTLFNDRKISGKGGQEVARGIPIPTSEKVKDYVSHIEKLVPATDPPSIFGLPENINFSYQKVHAEHAIHSLRALDVGEVAMSNIDEAVGPIISLWKKLCSSGDFHKMKAPDEKSRNSVLSETLALQLSEAVGVIQKIQNSLKLVSKAVRSSAGVSATTKSTIRAIVMHRTPDEWLESWALGPMEPSQFLNSLILKLKSTVQMLKESEGGQLLSRPLDLAEMFAPTVFLNAMRQATASSIQKPIDDLQMTSSWTPSKLTGNLVLQVKGLVLQGASFDGSLKENTASSPSVSSVPSLFLAFTTDQKTDPEDHVKVPLYYDSTRADLIAEVEMKCRDPLAWDIAAIALFLKQ